MQVVARSLGEDGNDISFSVSVGADALIEWERRVAGGKAPMAAADEIIAEYTPRFTRRSTATADGNTRAPGATRAPGSTQTARAGGVTRVDRNGNIIQGD